MHFLFFVAMLHVMAEAGGQDNCEMFDTALCHPFTPPAGEASGAGQDPIVNVEVPPAQGDENAPPAPPKTSPEEKGRPKIIISQPHFPEAPSSSKLITDSVSVGGIKVGTKASELGAAISSLQKDGFEYVINEPKNLPTYHRGASFTAALFLNSPLDASGRYHTYYNDCMNPIETGSVADFSSEFKGIASPAMIFSESAATLQSISQLAYYLDPNPETCVPGKVNSLPAGKNNAALSPLFLGKTVRIENIGDEKNPLEVKNVISIDFDLVTSEEYTFSGVSLAFASLDPDIFTVMHTFDPRTKTLKRVEPGIRDKPGAGDSAGPSYGPLPVIASSSDSKHAVAIYSPQIPLSGEGRDKELPGQTGYLRDKFEVAGVTDIHAYVRKESLRAGHYLFKVYYVVGTQEEVKAGLNELHSYFKILDPRVFDWRFYTEHNTGLGGFTEDEARLHWITTGIQSGLKASADFSVKEYLSKDPALAAKFGEDYFRAVLHFLQ